MQPTLEIAYPATGCLWILSNMIRILFDYWQALSFEITESIWLNYFFVVKLHILPQAVFGSLVRSSHFSLITAKLSVLKSLTILLNSQITVQHWTNVGPTCGLILCHCWVVILAQPLAQHCNVPWTQHCNVPWICIDPTLETIIGPELICSWYNVTVQYWTNVIPILCQCLVAILAQPLAQHCNVPWICVDPTLETIIRPESIRVWSNVTVQYWTNVGGSIEPTIGRLKFVLNRHWQPTLDQN